ncbi:M24 family metallopeptidase [Mycoplasmatota bacterium zrk1]
MKEQFRLCNDWLVKRLDTVVPLVMERTDIDMWIVIGSENNEDPVLKTMLPQEFFGAVGKNILVFCKLPDGKVDRLTVSRPLSAIDYYYKPVWYKQKGKDWKSYYEWMNTQNRFISVNLDNYEEETEWECLNRIVREYKPKSIGLNYSKRTKFADGISHSEYTQIKECLDNEYKDKITSADLLAVGWLETRIKEEIEYYEELTNIAQSLIKRAYSKEVIEVGKTTSGDVRWFLMQEATDLGLKPWFEATVWINREGVKGLDHSAVIEYGDLLHCDFGVQYMGLCTDIQEMCYILKPNETDIPSGILKGQAEANRLQDILAEEMTCGLTGNDVFEATIKRAKSEGMKPSVYTHPIGFHGHGAGPLIGLFTAQKPIPRGDRILYASTMYSFELNVTASIDEWNGQEVMYGLETDCLLREDNTIHYFGKRLMKPHIIK